MFIKNPYECKCKGYNAWQVITEFPERFDEEQHQQAAGEVEKVRNSLRVNR